jgi:hypothetical protein
MATGWKPERRAAQAVAIRNWKPWEHSTGPRTADGKQRSARNAYRGNQRGEFRHLMKHMRELLRAARSERRLCDRLYRVRAASVRGFA